MNRRVDIHGTPYPNYVNTDELRTRWNVAKRIAEVQAVIGGAIRGSGEFNLYVWHSHGPSSIQTSRPAQRMRSTTKMLVAS